MERLSSPSGIEWHGTSNRGGSQHKDGRPKSIKRKLDLIQALRLVTADPAIGMIDHNVLQGMNGPVIRSGSLGRGNCSTMRRCRRHEQGDSGSGSVRFANTPKSDDHKSTCCTYSEAALQRVPPLISRYVDEPFDTI